MASDRQPVCFTCSQPIAESPEINKLENGEACPTCRDRLLDSLPPLLPFRGRIESEDAAPEEPYPFESSDDGYDPPTGA